jgi:uncharacterized coiled-coil protein SlyX
MGIELERLEKLNERVHRLESAIYALRSTVLEQEATISEIMERLNACNIGGRSSNGTTEQVSGT